MLWWPKFKFTVNHIWGPRQTFIIYLFNCGFWLFSLAFYDTSSLSFVSWSVFVLPCCPEGNMVHCLKSWNKSTTDRSFLFVWFPQFTFGFGLRRRQWWRRKCAKISVWALLVVSSLALNGKSRYISFKQKSIWGRTTVFEYQPCPV